MNFRMLRKLSRRLEIITHFFHVFIEANSKITVPPILHMTYRVNNHSAANTELLKYRIRIFYKMPLLKNVWRLDINPERRGFAVWRSPMPWTMDAWCLDFKFFKAKIITQIGRYFYKCLKNSVFWRKNVWLMQNQGLGRHSDDIPMWWKKHPKYPIIHSTNRLKHLGYVQKNLTRRP